MLLILLLYALFASVFTTAKFGLEFTQPLFFVGSRMLVAGVLLLGYTFFIKKEKITFNNKLIKRVLLLSFFAIYLTNALEFWGLQYLTSFKTCFIYSLSPFVSALFSYLIFSETMTPKKWLGIFIGFIGFIPILLTENGDTEIGHVSFLSLAELAIIIAAVVSVYGWILLRQLIKENGLSPIASNGLAMTIGGATALVHSLFVENWAPIPVTSMAPFLQCVLILIIVSNLICYNLYGYLLKKYTATLLSFAGWTTPIFSAIFGWYFLGETISLPFFISLGVVLCGLLVFHQEELKQGYYIKSETKDGNSKSIST